MIMAATLNIQGMKMEENRVTAEVEHWMTRKRIEILGLQETHEPENKIKRTNRYT